MPTVRLAIVCLLLSSVSLYSQTIPPILQASQYKKGIYKSYSEFLRNAPSISDGFTYKTNSSDKKIEKDEAVYTLSLLDSASTRRDIRRLWGFCDGKDIFVNEARIFGVKETKFNEAGNFSRARFRKFLGIGRYCYVLALPSEAPIMTSPSPGTTVLVPNVARMIDGVEPFVLNVNNGKFFLLDKPTLTRILEKDPALLQEYKLDERKRKEDTFIAYVERYNETHLNEANLELWLDRQVVILRDAKKELSEPLNLTLNDTSAMAMKPNSLERLTLQGEKVKVCAGDKCTDIPLVRKGTTYIQVSQQKVGQDAVIRAIDDAVGEARVKDISETETKKPE
ncbi:MAG TPA: hypothetical protein VGD40_11210 [Chryseosolibacter sp.]